MSGRTGVDFGRTAALGSPGHALAVELHGISYAYPAGVEALAGFTLDVPGGSTVGLVGPSGCGKSTLLAILAGLRTPSRGAIEWPSRAKHRLALMFQRDTLLPWATVEENVTLYYKFHRHDPREIKAIADDLLRLAGLAGFEKAYPYQLSGGMRRRVAFLSSVAARPDLLLLDEPFSSLDEPTRLTIHQMVFRITKEFGMTTVLVTHDLAEAISLCDRVVLVSRRPGRVIENFEVPFGRDRDIAHLRARPDFLELYGRIWEGLSNQITASQPEAGGRN